MVLRLNVVWECGFQYHWWKGTKLISVTCSICFVRVQTHRMFKLGKSSDIYSQAGVPKMSDFFSLGIFLTFLGKMFNISACSETPTISYNIFSHLHRIVIYQKNQSNHRLFLLFNLIRQINRPIRIRPAQILKTAKKWKKNFRKLLKKFLNSKNFWNRRTKGMFFRKSTPIFLKFELVPPEVAIRTELQFSNFL